MIVIEKPMSPDDLKVWIEAHGYNLTSFCRMMKLHRRTFQRRIYKRAFPQDYAFIVTMFCRAYDLGFRVQGMEFPQPRRRGNYGAGRPRKNSALPIRHIDLPF